MASVTRRIRRNVATREALFARMAYAKRRIDANQRDAALERANAHTPARPARFARALTLTPWVPHVRA
jgi:hypothetical protein